MDLSMQSPYDSSHEESSSEEESEDSLDYDDLFTMARILNKIVVQYISCVSSQHEHVTDMLESVDDLPESKNLKDFDTSGDFFQKLVSVGQEIKVFFKVPNKQIMSNISPTLNPSEVVAAFINFLLQLVEVILRRFVPDSIAFVKDSMEMLRTELGFLITFLGDTAMHLQSTKNIVIDIEALVNEVGSFLYSFLFTTVVFILITEANYAMPHMEALVDELRSFLHSGLFTFLEDLLQISEVELEEVKKQRKIKRKEKKKAIMMGIKAQVHEVRSSLDFITFPEIDPIPGIGILDLAISDFLPKFELLKTKIKEHCITVSKMPSDMTPKTTLVSLFIVDSVLDDLMYLINNNSGKIVSVKDQIVTLHEELMLLGSSIIDIKLQHEAEHEELAIRTRDIAYEVEYVINSFPPVWYLTLRLPQLIEKIQLIRMAIQEIKNTIDAAGMPEVAKYGGDEVSLQSKGPPILEDVVGFEKVETEIVEQLVIGMERLQIISIFGMPGLGKTTLAKKLYNHPSIGLRFDVRAWCDVSQTYEKRNMLTEILMSIGHLKRETFMNMDDEDLGEKLYKSLKRRRYLVVIDDIWDTNAWNELERYFPREHVGSRILFTTRNKEVGLKASASVMKELPFLSKDECWELLQRKVFQKDNCPQELLDIGKQIARSCHGLPLSVVTIAGVLANMEKKEHLWRKVARNLTSHISGNSAILEFSYKYLPMHLKPCFLYFGAFKEDEEIPVRNLLSLWIAEGYVKKEEEKCIEDVALKYLMELIDRSLVLVAKRRSDGQVKTCKIHDLLREMCLRIADEKHFLKVVTLNNDDPAQFFSQHHCLIMNYMGAPIISLPFGLHVRSLLRVYRGSITFNSRSFKVLRVLDCQSRLVYVVGIEYLVHLRYLVVPLHLPPMESFHKLEFLDMYNKRPVEIPEILLNMVSLRRMYFSHGAYFSESCRQQATKDESFQLNSNLKSISALELHDETDEKILRCLRNLGRLTIWSKSSLNYSSDFFYQLESLKLYNVGGSSSSLISLPLYVKRLTLVNVHVSPKEMELIERLLNLEVLKFVDVSFKGREWDTSEIEFPQIKFLKLCSSDLAEWNASSDNFPRLQQLVLGDCRDLKMIPSSFGGIPTLQMIEVYGCKKSVKESAKQIQEEQLDMGNGDLKVIILDMGSEEQEEIESEEQEESGSEAQGESESEEQDENGIEEREEKENEELSD